MINGVKRKTKHVLINMVANSNLIPMNRIRLFIYRCCGIKLESDNITILPGALMNGTNIKIGKGTFINYKSIFENEGYIEIGKNCAIGMEVMFCAATHEIGSKERRQGKVIGKPIKVGDGCWVGSRVTILPGVTIGFGCVIGAGSLVTRDCEPNGLYVGAPARRVKELECD